MITVSGWCILRIFSRVFLAELAHIFSRWCIAYFFKNLPLKQNQSSKSEPEKSGHGFYWICFFYMYISILHNSISSMHCEQYFRYMTDV